MIFVFGVVILRSPIIMSKLFFSFEFPFSSIYFIENSWKS